MLVKWCEKNYINVVTMFCFMCMTLFNQFPAPVVTPEIVSNEEAPSTSQGLPLAVGPQLPPAEPQLDLEQQWQDIMAIMELQVCSVFKNDLLSCEMYLFVLPEN